MKTPHFIHAVFLLLVLFGAPLGVSAQLSPGDLMQSHAHLEGMNNCTQCHTFGEKISDTKCLDCHTEIKQLVKANRGYHSSTQVKAKKCVDCHSDHHGQKFDAIRFDSKSFKHEMAGYKLEGAHAKVDCKSCHKPANIQNKTIAKRENTWLGLEQDCLDCHDDFHQGTLAGKCTDCHTMNAFRPAEKFNHNMADFKLVGAHTKVDCNACHPTFSRNGNDFQQFNDLKFESCVDCHTDVHNGQFGINCKQCHTETSFTQVKGNVDFDHSKTGFPLVGQHTKVSCQSCHKGTAFSSSFNPNACKSCHADFHRNQFTSKNPTSDCKDCHSVYAPFSQTSYSITQHNEAKFPLEGAHLATPCFDCHRVNNKWEFRNLGNDCFECHGDVHKQTMSATYYNGTNCTACHTTGGWRDITFEHAKTGFALEGKHATVDCRSCHSTAERNAQPSTKEELKFLHLSSQCAECHTNVHGNQFEENLVTNCQKCHSSAWEWKADKFEHSSTQFPLTGKHAQVNCAACHTSKEDDIVVYKIKKFECIDCHS